MSAIRQPAFAGQFYPENPAELSAAVKEYLDAADDGDARVPKAIIAPHAGYIYSGPVAATAYKRLAPARDTITRVALLGPCHRVAVSGLALSGADAFATPLGNIKLDAPAAAKIGSASAPRPTASSPASAASTAISSTTKSPAASPSTTTTPSLRAPKDNATTTSRIGCMSSPTATASP